MAGTGMFDLSGRVAFVTGGNGGIGLGMAKAFVENGAQVAIIGRNQSKLDTAKAELAKISGADKVLAVQCDVTDKDSVESSIDTVMGKFGRLDILVNNAGVNRRAEEPHLLKPEDWQYVIDVNLTSIHTVTSAAFPHMKKGGRGKIINIGSMMSIFGTAYAVAYAASKGGVVQYTKSCAVAWANYNVQVNAVLPGWIVTEMTDQFKKAFPERYAMIVGRTPADRWGQPSDLGGTAVFLASSASDFVTGVSIPVDGGYSVW
jgi:2-deoxy-D-gluconate 3-dehydrogenase